MRITRHLLLIHYVHRCSGSSLFQSLDFGTSDNVVCFATICWKRSRGPRALSREVRVNAWSLRNGPPQPDVRRYPSLARVFSAASNWIIYDAQCVQLKKKDTPYGKNQFKQSWIYLDPVSGKGTAFSSPSSWKIIKRNAVVIWSIHPPSYFGSRTDITITSLL